MTKNEETNDSLQEENLKRHQEAMEYTIELLETMFKESAAEEKKTGEE